MRTRLAGIAVVVVVALTLVTGAVGDGGGSSPGTVTGWDGIVTSTGAIRYVALPAKNSTTMVAAVRTRDGRVLRWSWSPLRGAFGVPLVTYGGDVDGISANGRVLVLAAAPLLNARNATASTRFAVVRLPGLQRATPIVLDGIWAFDAISPDGKTIFAIEYASADLSAPRRYRVRTIDVERGTVRPGAVVDRHEPREPMVGLPMTRAYGPGRHWVYTLYSRPNGTAFIHALDTVRSTARCIDLPWRAITEPYGLRLSFEPATLTMRIKQRGRLVGRVDLRSFTVRRLGDVS